MSPPKPIPDNPPRKDEQCEDNCPPCFPVVGTIRYRYDFLNSAAHYNKINIPALGAQKEIMLTLHLNLSVMQQSPKIAGCRCFWKNLHVAVPPPSKT